MTALRQRCIEDLQRRGLSARTQESYVRVVRQLAEHYGKSPEVISEEELRQYLLYLKNEKHAARNPCTLALCSLKLFYQQTLKREWPTLDFVRPAREKKLPVVLSVAEVRRLLSCVRHGKGNKDRYVALPQRLLEQLRAYWRTHRHPTWLFPGAPRAGQLSPAPMCES